MKVVLEFLSQYGYILAYTALTAIAGVLGAQVKKLYDRMTADRYYGYGLPDLSSYVEKANLQRHTPISMRIDSFPTKRIYSYKSQTSIDMEGMVLSITYADGSVRTVNDLSTIHVTALNTNKIGNQDITVTFEDVSATFSVEVRYAWWQWLIRILLFGWIWY